MSIHESGEMYLETILLLSRQSGAVRSVDIASELSVSKASVSRAMGVLRGGGYITMEQYGDVTLTDKGRAAAEAIYERHRVLTQFLVKSLGLDEKTAAADACRIEHVISAEAFERIKALMNE